MKEIYQMTKTEVRKEINGGLHPLTNTQVLKRQKKFGPNELVEGKKKGKMQIFLEQFKDFLVIILILAATVSGFLGDW